MSSSGTLAVAKSPRRIAWERRRAAIARVWREYRKDPGGLVGLVILTACVGLALAAPYITDPTGLEVIKAEGELLAPPSADYPLGTDPDGRSVLLLTLWGARVSLLIGFLAAALSIGIGTLVGIMAGHFRGVIGAALMRVTDFFLVLPVLPLAIVLSAVRGGGLGTIIVVIGVTTWPTTARLVRAQTLAIEARPYLERARALGAGHWHQMSRHVLPNVLPLVFAKATLTVASAILLEATLAFLGVSTSSGVSWGSMLERAHYTGAASVPAWWYLMPPGVAILIVVLAFTLCGRALEAVLNPRLRER